MKLIKFFTLAIAATLMFASCGDTSSDEPVLGTYSCTCDQNVASSTPNGVIFFAMQNEVIKVSKDFNFRTKENDNAVIAAADKVAKEYKDQAEEKTLTVSVIFTEANAMGKPENKPVVLKDYTFTPID